MQSKGSRGEAHSKDAVPRRQPRGCVSLPYNAKSVLVMRFLNDKAGAYLGEMTGVKWLAVKVRHRRPVGLDLDG